MRFEMGVVVVSIFVPCVVIFGMAYVVFGRVAMEGFPVLWGVFAGWIGGYYVAARHRGKQGMEETE